MRKIELKLKLSCSTLVSSEYGTKDPLRRKGIGEKKLQFALGYAIGEQLDEKKTFRNFFSSS